MTKPPLARITIGLLAGLAAASAPAAALRPALQADSGPQITIDAPKDGQGYAVGQVVPADYRCDNDADGVASCQGTVGNGDPIDTSSRGQKTFTVVAEDGLGNTSQKQVVYHVFENVKPTIAIAAPSQGAAYSRGQVVAASYSCADTGGSGLTFCSGTVPSGSAIDTSALGTKSFTVSARDGDGNIESRSVTYMVVDGTPPVVTIDAPREGETYLTGQILRAAYHCTDEGGSRLASCSGSVADGAIVDTSTPGARSFTVSASDNAGNVAARTVGYRVVDGSSLAPSDATDGGAIGQVESTGRPSARAAGKGIVVDTGLTATCAGDVDCTFRISARTSGAGATQRGSTTIGRARLRVDAGDEARVRFRLTRSAVKLLRKRRTLTARVSVTGASRATRTIKIRQPKRARRR